MAVSLTQMILIAINLNLRFNTDFCSLDSLIPKTLALVYVAITRLCNFRQQTINVKINKMYSSYLGNVLFAQALQSIPMIGSRV